MIDIVEFCGTKFGRGINKFKECKLKAVPGKNVKTNLIKECPVNLECKVIKEINIGGSHVWFIGKIETAYIDDTYEKTEALIYWKREYRTIGDVLFTRL